MKLSLLIQTVTQRKSGWEISKRLTHDSIGVRYNQWRKPVTTWGPGEPGVMQTDICEFHLRNTMYIN